MVKQIQVNPCPVCVQRYGPTDMNSINDCCYQTCASFVSGTQSDVIRSECGQRCKQCIQGLIQSNQKNPCQFHLPVPSIRLDNQNFKVCLERVGNKDQALECCLQASQCTEDTERCVNAYRSVTVQETFTLPSQHVKHVVGILGVMFVVLIFIRYVFSRRIYRPQVIRD